MLISPNRSFLGGAAAEHHGQACLEIRLAQIVPLLTGNLLRHTQRLSVRDNRDFLHWIGRGCKPCGHRMAGFVTGNHAPLPGIRQLRMRNAEPHTIVGFLEIHHRNRASAPPRGSERRFVAQVGQIRTAQPNSNSRKH